MIETKGRKNPNGWACSVEGCYKPHKSTAEALGHTKDWLKAQGYTILHNYSAHKPGMPVRIINKPVILKTSKEGRFTGKIRRFFPKGDFR